MASFFLPSKTLDRISLRYDFIGLIGIHARHKYFSLPLFLLDGELGFTGLNFFGLISICSRHNVVSF